MPKFDVIYREGARGETRRAEFEGHAESLVRRDIESRGGRVLAIMRLADGGAGHWLRNLVFGKLKISLRFSASTSDLAMLCEVFKALYSSGVPMLQILQMTIEETPNPWLKKRLIVVLERVRDGEDVSTAMDDPRCRKAFPSLMRETIRTGEANGRLDQSLQRLAETFKRAAETKRETISALLYPAVAFIVFVVVCTIIAIMVPNALEETLGPEELENMKDKFPMAIQVLFFLRKHKEFLIIPPAAIVTIGILWAIGKKTKATRVALTRIERKVPMLGSLLFQFALVRFLDLLAANNETGIQVAESLRLIQGGVNDALIEGSLGRVRNRILTAGEGLGEALSAPEELSVFPGLVRQMVRAGEESGRLTEMLLPIIAFYGDQAKATLKRTLDMLTPAMIILLGAVIGPVVIGVYKMLIIMTEVQANSAG